MRASALLLMTTSFSTCDAATTRTAAMDAHGERCAPVELKRAGEDALERGQRLGGRHLGEEAEPAEVDAEDGSSRSPTSRATLSSVPSPPSDDEEIGGRRRSSPCRRSALPTTPAIACSASTRDAAGEQPLDHHAAASSSASARSRLTTRPTVRGRLAARSGFHGAALGRIATAPAHPARCGTGRG